MSFIIIIIIIAFHTTHSCILHAINRIEVAFFSLSLSLHPSIFDRPSFVCFKFHYSQFFLSLLSITLPLKEFMISHKINVNNFLVDMNRCRCRCWKLRCVFFPPENQSLRSGVHFSLCTLTLFLFCFTLPPAVNSNFFIIILPMLFESNIENCIDRYHFWFFFLQDQWQTQSKIKRKPTWIMTLAAACHKYKQMRW